MTWDTLGTFTRSARGGVVASKPHSMRSTTGQCYQPLEGEPPSKTQPHSKTRVRPRARPRIRRMCKLLIRLDLERNYGGLSIRHTDGEPLQDAEKDRTGHDRLTQTVKACCGNTKPKPATG